MKKVLLFCLLIVSCIFTFAISSTHGTKNILGPFTTDAGITTIDNLPAYSGNHDVSVTLKNFGTDILTSCTINWEVDGNLQTGYNWSGSLIQDATITEVIVGNFNFAAGSHTVKVYSSNPNNASDLDASNDTLTVTFNFNQTISTFSYCESFENTLGDWVQATDDNDNWTILSGATQTSNTGPDLAYSGSYYIYYEASNITTGNTANVELYADFTTVNNPIITFYYHMYGTAMGSLHLDIYNFATSTWTTDVWSLSGNQGNNWIFQTVNLASFANAGVVKIRFRGIRGTQSSSDMALDQVCVSSLQPIDAGLNSLNINQSSCSNNNASLTVQIKNFGGDTLQEVPVVVNITDPTGNVVTYNDTLVAQLLYNATQNLTLTNIDLSLVGTYSIEAYTLVVGDGDLTNDTMTASTLIIPNISSFPFYDNFEAGNQYYMLQGTTYASASIDLDATTHALHFTGGAVNTGWTGQGTTTTATQAWTTNTTHHAFAYTCNVDATGQTMLRMKFDLKQTSPANYNLYNWFRVMVNGTTQLADINGVSNFNGSQTNAYSTKEFDLTPYAGTQFTLTFQAAVKYNSAYNATSYPGGDNVYFDNLNIYFPNDNDIQVASIINLSGSSCASSSVDVKAIITNTGMLTQDTIPVTAQITDPLGAIQVLSGFYYDSLQASTSDTVTLGTISTLIPGTYSIIVYSSLPGDLNNNNDTLTTTITTVGVINSYPFTENFEAGNNYFILSGTTYATASINTEGTNHALYITGGSVNTGWTGQGTNTTEAQAWANTTHHAWAYTCMIDATSLTALMLKFDLKQVSPASYYLYNWLRILINDTVQIADLNSDTYFNPDGSNIYHTIQFNLSQYAGTLFKLTFQAAVKYNINYVGGTYPGGGDNIYIDNINLTIPPANEMELSSINGIPASACNFGSETVGITLFNNGSQPILTGTTFSASYSVNNAAPVSETFTLLSDINFGAGSNFTFTTPANLSSDGTYLIKAWIDNANDPVPENDTTITSTENIASISTFPYTQDFETNSDGWTQITVAGTSWTLGTPAHTNINSAHSGINAWMTGLTQSYLINSETMLMSPCFDFTTISNISLSFWMNYLSESFYDGMVLESTIDGTNWVKVGENTSNFYNATTMSATGYPFTAPWWSGTTITGWHAYNTIPNDLLGESSVRFRYHFMSDYTLVNEGMAIDDFSIDNIFLATASDDDAICTGATANLSVNASGGLAPYTYLWSPGSSLSDSTIQNPIATPTVTTTYYVTVTDATGATSVDQVVITIVPPIVINFPGNQSFCEGTDAVLDAGNGYQSYLWSTGETTQTITVIAAGTFSVQVADVNGCTGQSNPTVIGFLPNPVVNLGPDQTLPPTTSTYTLDAGITGIYLWSTGATTRTIDITISGIYSVTVTDGNGCSGSDNVVITFTNSITAISNELSVLITPNPSNGKFNIVIENMKNENLSIEITDITGQLVYHETCKHSASLSKEIDLQQLSSGVYNLKLNNDNSEMNKKIIIY